MYIFTYFSVNSNSPSREKHLRIVDGGRESREGAKMIITMLVLLLLPIGYISLFCASERARERERETFARSMLCYEYPRGGSFCFLRRN